MQNRLLVVARMPFADEFVRPHHVLFLLRVAHVAGVGRLEGDRGGRRWGQHGVIASHHPGKAALRHVTVDAPPPGLVGLVAGVGLGICDPLFVTRQTRIVGLGGLGESIPPAGCMAVHAIQLAGLDARAHSPTRVRVVLSEVPAVRIEVGALQRHETVVVEIAVSGLEARCDRIHLGVTRRARGVVLGGSKALRDDQLQVFRWFVFRCGPADADVLGARTVTRFAVNSGLGPDTAVRVGLQIVVDRELADVAVVAGCVKRVGRIPPWDRFVRRAIVEVPHAAGRRVIPLPGPQIVRDGQHLQAPLLHGRQEVIDVLAAHDVGDRVLPGAIRPAFQQAPGVPGEVGSIRSISDLYIDRLPR